MALKFEFKIPKKIIFENNSIDRAGGIIKSLFEGKALIITDEVMKKIGIFDRLKKSLENDNLDFEVFDNVSSEPLDSYVKEGLDFFKNKECKHIIALGGGSPIDTAKAISAMTINPGKISDYKGLGMIKKKGVPLIAIPTTAGTGSEVTSFTVITDASANIKMLIGSEHIIPDIAIIDPTLTFSCPPSLTAAVGIDALIHAIEAYISKKATPISDIFALEAIKLIYGNLRKAYISGNDKDAREKIMIGATLAGVAFGNSSVALVHGMSRPIGAHFHIPHGVSNAALLSTVMEFSYSSDTKRFADISRVIRINTSIEDEEKVALKAVDLLTKLINDLKIPSLSELGVDKEKLEELAPSMARAALDSGSPSNNPRVATENEIIDLYLKAY